jgi:hypothetical protein
MTGIQESACDIGLPPIVASQAGLEHELLVGRFCLLHRYITCVTLGIQEKCQRKLEHHFV